MHILGWNNKIWWTLKPSIWKLNVTSSQLIHPLIPGTSGVSLCKRWLGPGQRQQHTGNMFCVRRFRGAGTFAFSWWPRKQDPVTIMNKNICLESSSNLKIQCLVLTFFHRIWMNVSFIFFNFRQVCVVWSSPWRAPMRTTSRSMRQFYQWMLC